MNPKTRPIYNRKTPLAIWLARDVYLLTQWIQFREETELQQRNDVFNIDGIVMVEVHVVYIVDGIEVWEQTVLQQENDVIYADCTIKIDVARIMLEHSNGSRSG